MLFFSPLERNCKLHEVLLLFVLSSFMKHLPDAGRKSLSVKLLQEDKVHLRVLHAFFRCTCCESFYLLYVSKLFSCLASCVCVCLKATACVVSTSGQKGLSYAVKVLLPSFWFPPVPQPPTITQQSPKDYIIDPRENIIIHCEAKGKPHPR